MPGSTAQRDYPYPSLGDANNPPYWQQALAEALDGDVAEAMAVTAEFDTAWQSFTPAITCGGSAITLGNGTLKGRYLRRGKSILTEVYLLFGSSTSYGGHTGNLQIGVPFPSDGHTWTPQPFPIGTVWANGPSGQFFGNVVIFDSNTAVNPLTAAGGLFTHASLTSAGHYLVTQFEYPRA